MSPVAAAFLDSEPLLFNGGIPSNFWQAPIPMWDPFSKRMITVATNEHYFQAAKVRVAAAGTAEMFAEIAMASSPMSAKQLGRRVPLSQEELRYWQEGGALAAMLECNTIKYTHVVDPCRRWLVGTGNRPLVEHRPDPIWGDNMDGSGRNLLGKTLELVRALVR